MKCPKCGYLGFDSGNRCRNCGYDFSLAPPSTAALDLTLEREVESPLPALDLDRLIGADEPVPASDLPLFEPPQPPDAGSVAARAATVSPTSGRAAHPEDAPLIQMPSRPRPPLGVRRATPEVPRARTRTRKPTPHHEDLLFEPPSAFVTGPGVDAHQAADRAEPAAAASRRIVAALLDASLLGALDALVLYFTLSLSGLTTVQMASLPLLPLAGFFLLLNGGYFVAFTTVGGQSIGKMALGIKVISQEAESVPVSRATVRTLAYLASALPLGAGFLAGVFSADRLALHDRLAHTRVIRLS
jgi:uncharacterized RDD family membrane protein YckC